jgi:PAS domain S-box-containing protein
MPHRLLTQQLVKSGLCLDEVPSSHPSWTEFLAGIEQSYRELAESISMLRSSLESTRDGILVVSLEGGITLFNTRFTEIWGLAAEELTLMNEQGVKAALSHRLADPGALDAIFGAHPCAGQSEVETLFLKEGGVIEVSSRSRFTDGKCTGRVWAFLDVDQRLSEVDVHPIIDSAISLAKHELRHRVQLVKRLEPIPKVAATEAKIGQVILNLLVNATHAIPVGNADRNEIRISTRTDEAGRAVIEVTDTGVGIPPGLISHVFDPFFTTQPTGSGTGLGLTICRSIVTGLGGEIEVESQVGVGSTFRVRLPAFQGKPAKPDPVASAPASKQRARILIIDDEPLLAESLKRILSPSHDAQYVASGAEGLRLLSSGQAFDLILCDLMMPRMSGSEFHAELLRLHPQYAERILVVTGGAFSPEAARFLESIGDRRIEKPFTTRGLLAKIHEALARLPAV